jgi:hypothetical protein
MENNQPQKIIKFEDVKDQIMAALQDPSKKFGIEEEVTLFDGFVNQPVCTELSGTYMIGGPTMPMIMLIGNDSGKIHFLALKAILEDIDL